MSDIVKIGQIASIQSGYSFKSKILGSPTGTIAVFQPADILHGELITTPQQVDALAIRNINHHLLSRFDILLANKGTRFSTFLYDNISGASIAASSFFVIRPDIARIDPEYLLWNLGRTEITQALESQVRGSTVLSLKLKTVEQLQIPLPSLALQQKVACIVALAHKQDRALQKLMAAKKERTELYCLDLIDRL